MTDKNFPGPDASSAPSAPLPDDDAGLTNLGIAGNLTRAFIKSPLTPLFLLAAFAFGHGMIMLELDERFPPQADIDAAWRAGTQALRAAAT